MPVSEDDRPIGPPLRAIVLLGPTGTPVANATTGVTVERMLAPRIDGRQLRPFLGQTLSLKLIAEIEARIVEAYRHSGFPLVSVSTPKQEITSGVLQIRIIEFRLGAKHPIGAPARDAARIEQQIRATTGDPIDIDLLSQDIDWLNRYPFRHAEVVFAPGAAFGTTDLKIYTTHTKPWSVYSGYANSGGPSTGSDRYFAGAQIALPLLRDAVASYQFTGSHDVIFDQGGLFATAANPAYLSHAGRLNIPTAPRQAIEVSVNYVDSTQPIQDFLVSQTTFEGAINYRSALSNAWNRAPGDVSAGLAIKRQTSRVSFAGLAIRSSAFDDLQVTLSFAGQEIDQLGRGSGSVVLHASPGGIGDHADAASLTDLTGGRARETTYAYVSGNFARTTSLPSLFGLRGFTLVDTIAGQYAARSLPETEQIGLGNSDMVRGYTLDDGAFDTGLVNRNELRAPSFPLLGRYGKPPDLLSPFVFFDIGYGKDRRTKAERNLAASGVGLDYQFANHLHASIDSAWALRSVGKTRSGDGRLECRLTVGF